jgi:hypothetical protein
MPGSSDVEYFARLVDALEPWLGQFVIIGGWAHRLYRLHPLAQKLDYEPLGTFDTDVAVPLNLPATGEQIHERLLGRDFHEELLGDTRPPAAHYRVQSGDTSFYAEFLTSLEGGQVKRGGRRDATARVSGVFVQKLRHLELNTEGLPHSQGMPDGPNSAVGQFGLPRSHPASSPPSSHSVGGSPPFRRGT